MGQQSLRRQLRTSTPIRPRRLWITEVGTISMTSTVSLLRFVTPPGLCRSLGSPSSSCDGVSGQRKDEQSTAPQETVATPLTLDQAASPTCHSLHLCIRFRTAGTLLRCHLCQP